MNWFVAILLLLLPTRDIFSEEISPSYLIADRIKKGLETQDEQCISALISGIEARDRNVLLSSDELRTHVLYVEKQREFLSQENLRETENWMQKLQLDKNIKEIIPLKLAYAIVKKGTGNLLTQKQGNVSVNYTIKKMGDSFPETTGKAQCLNLSEVIPGLAHGMLAMQEGEIRTIYIHPDLAYHSNNFDPNVGLEALVELLQIFPEQNEIPSLPEISRLASEEITQQELDRLQLKNYYVLGWKLWDHLRWGHKLFNKEELISCLKKEPLQIVSSQQEEEINKIYWKIYHQRIEEEYHSADVYLKNVSLQSDVKCLAPGFLYCQAKKMRDTPLNQSSFKARITIKDREGKILRPNRLETLNINETIKGLKESLPFLVAQEPATIFIHPKWAYPDVDGPLGDSLLAIDVMIE